MHGLVRKRAPTLPSAKSSSRWTCSVLLAETRWTQTFAARPTNQGGDEQFAIKLVRNDLQTDRERQLASGLLRREAEVGRTVAHRHLATTLGVERGIAGDLILVQPLNRGTPLLRSHQAMSLAAKLWILRQTAEALTALHNAGWLHGDVTPAAICVTSSGHVTLNDLGWSRQCSSAECDLATTRFNGCVRYAAPEAFDERGSITPAADVYSLGAIAFELLAGRAVFAEYEGPQVVAAKRMLTPPQLAPSHAPYGVRQLVASLLSRDPLRRPTASETAAALLPLEIEALRAA